MVRVNLKKTLLEMLSAFISAVTVLTPYMVFIVKVNLTQYLYWLLSQAIFCPILAPLIFKVSDWFKKKAGVTK